MTLKLARDLRLVPAVGAAVRHFAGQAGFDARAQADLSAAAEEACRESFPLLNSREATLAVTVEAYPGRVEVTLEHAGQAARAAGLATFAVPSSENTEASGLSGLHLLERVDRVLYSAKDGVSRTTLVKFLNVPLQPK